MTENQFYVLGCAYTKHKKKTGFQLGLRRFKCFFGVSPGVCSIIWDNVSSMVIQGSQPKHLLWALNFMKRYTDEHTRRVLFKCDEKTLRKWSWHFVELISNLNVVS